MVLAKSKNSVGLGNSLMNDRFGKGKGSDRKKTSHNTSIRRKDQNGETYVTNASEEAAWVKMRSITEQGALDEFLSTAELAGTDFTAEKLNNVKIIHTDQKNPYLLSSNEERSTLKKHQKSRARLTVPRRPKWNSKTTPQQLDTMERESLLDWRRGLAELQENQDILMTPFERNLEVWRQLWRVIERSDLIVQIVDARNPLLFRSADLEKYVKDIDPKKRNLLLVNKADMMTPKQREVWADYFDENGINYSFFSASLAKERNEANLESEDSEEDSDEEPEEVHKLAKEAKKIRLQDKKEEDEEWSSEEEYDNDGGLPISNNSAASRTNILTVDELEALFLSNAPEPTSQGDDPSKNITTVGLVGYPNVGKSSTINALLGAKKVSVSATPGKTKHFQTLYLTPTLLLCDCPGLVFPNFATTKAELVVNGVLPIDQQREFTGPAGLVAQRVPKHFIEAVYGIKIHTRPLEEGGTGVPTGKEVLRAYARARGFATTGQGQPDESRAARYILKDYVSGKLLFCHPPPVSDTVLETGDRLEAVDPLEFNKDLYDVSHLPARRQALFSHNPSMGTPSLASESIDNDDDSIPISLSEASGSTPHPQGARSRNIDQGFFKSGAMSNAGHLKMPFNDQYTEQGAKRHKELTGRKQRAMIALEKGIDISEVRGGVGKKHFKGGKRREKQRSKAEAAKSKDIDDF
ncbi:hypothetical protein FQN54_007513 [Arachnomyces sp. PD_36]|nr:hypothetical protein FQN54_007513 [Arachnomyces sp. PD_36]